MACHSTFFSMVEECFELRDIQSCIFDLHNYVLNINFAVLSPLFSVRVRKFEKATLLIINRVRKLRFVIWGRFVIIAFFMNAVQLVVLIHCMGHLRTNNPGSVKF